MAAAASKSLTYLVTGGAGFIGSYLIESLLAEGHRVLAIDDLSTGRAENLAAVTDHPNFSFDRAALEEQVVMDRLSSEADVIVHLAAGVGVKLAVEHPVRSIETNVSGTERILQAALRYHCRVLIASSSEVYGKGSKVPFAEDDNLVLGAPSEIHWSYAAGKILDEFLTRAYRHEFGLPVTICRLFNTVGPRQNGRYGMVIPRFVAQALGEQPIEVFGSGAQTRSFCDVRDVVEAIVSLARHPQALGRVFNIGSSEEISILALAERVRALTGSSSPIVQVPYEKAYLPGFEEVMRRVPDTSRIRSLLGWQPKRALDEILENVIEHEVRGGLRSADMPVRKGLSRSQSLTGAP